MSETLALGRYKVDRRLATGGMSEVYLARQEGIEGLTRHVVIKHVLREHLDNDEFLTMFLDEARLMAGISHPNVAQVFDLGNADGTYFLVMEYVDGPTLAQLLATHLKATGKPLPIHVALAITLEIADALLYLHELKDEYGRHREIVHRDLNPSNVLIGYNGCTKLIDFGIAKAASKVYQTRMGVIKGTYGYISPEQYGRGSVVDHRADIFSLGVLLFEISVGTLPYGSPEDPELIERLTQGNFTRPHTVDPEFPQDLEELLSRCLAPNPDDRPSGMRELIADIHDCLNRRGNVPRMNNIADFTKTWIPKADRTPQRQRAASSSEVRPVPTNPGTSLPRRGDEDTVATATPSTVDEPSVPQATKTASKRHPVNLLLLAGGLGLALGYFWGQANRPAHDPTSVEP